MKSLEEECDKTRGQGYIPPAIRLLVMDVDGTLTDGRLFIGPGGEVCKAFDVKDGFAIAQMLPQMDIIPAILTARQSDIVTKRAEELSIKAVFQGIRDKAAFLRRFCEEYQIPLEQTAYIGDDIPDLPSMKMVSAAGGLTACPADAAKEVRMACDIVTSVPGGQGAVREFVEWLRREGRYREKDGTKAAFLSFPV